MSDTIENTSIDELVGAVDHDIADDPFPVKGIDHLRFYVGNAKQAAFFYSAAMGMTCIAYRGPEQGSADACEYVMRSGSARFVLTGPTMPGTAVGDFVTRHGDGVVDIAIEVPDVEKNYSFAMAQGATGLDEPHSVEDEHGKVIFATIAAYGDTRHTLIDRSNYGGPFLPGFVARDPIVASVRGQAACSAPSTTWSATSNSGRWTSGSPSTTRSWASPTWPSSSATTSPPTTRP